MPRLDEFEPAIPIPDDYISEQQHAENEVSLVSRTAEKSSPKNLDIHLDTDQPQNLGHYLRRREGAAAIRSSSREHPSIGIAFDLHQHSTKKLS